MVAARTTLQQFHAPPGLDPLSQHDPWAEAAAAKHKPVLSPAAAVAVESVQAIKAQLETSVLAKVRQAQASQVDTDGLVATVARLQPQLREASSTAQAALQRVQGLEVTVAEVSTKVDRQENTLRDMFSEQMSRIEELLRPKRQRQE